MKSHNIINDLHEEKEAFWQKGEMTWMKDQILF
jgi:hypothetical protein